MELAGPAGAAALQSTLLVVNKPHLDTAPPVLGAALELVKEHVDPTPASSLEIPKNPNTATQSRIIQLLRAARTAPLRRGLPMRW